MELAPPMNTPLSFLFFPFSPPPRFLMCFHTAWLVYKNKPYYNLLPPLAPLPNAHSLFPKAWEDGWSPATCHLGRMACLGLRWGNRSGTFLAVILAARAELLQQVEFHFAVERPVVGRREGERACVCVQGGGEVEI